MASCPRAPDPPMSRSTMTEVSGIIDIRDQHGYVRTSGYLPGSHDAHVSAEQVRRFGLRPGDAVTGAIGADDRAKGRDRRVLQRLDTINGRDVGDAAKRPDFYGLTPLYPQERIRLET